MSVPTRRDRPDLNHSVGDGYGQQGGHLRTTWMLSENRRARRTWLPRETSEAPLCSGWVEALQVLGGRLHRMAYIPQLPSCAFSCSSIPRNFARCMASITSRMRFRSVRSSVSARSRGTSFESPVATNASSN